MKSRGWEAGVKALDREAASAAHGLDAGRARLPSGYPENVITHGEEKQNPVLTTSGVRPELFLAGPRGAW